MQQIDSDVMPIDHICSLWISGHRYFKYLFDGKFGNTPKNVGFSNAQWKLSSLTS